MNVYSKFVAIMFGGYFQHQFTKSILGQKADCPHPKTLIKLKKDEKT